MVRTQPMPSRAAITWSAAAQMPVAPASCLDKITRIESCGEVTNCGAELEAGGALEAVLVPDAAMLGKTRVLAADEAVREALLKL